MFLRSSGNWLASQPCGPSNYEKLLVGEMNQYLDFFNLMAYDYSGSWEATVGHQANVFGNHESGVSTERAVQYYHERGVPKHKLVVGIPLYGRSFSNTDGLGHSYSGVGQGSWEQGVYDYKALVSDEWTISLGLANGPLVAVAKFRCAHRRKANGLLVLPVRLSRMGNL